VPGSRPGRPTKGNWLLVLVDPNGRDSDDLERKFSGIEESSSTRNPARFIHLYKECRVRRLADQKSDPLHELKGANLANSFSNAFSNAGGYARSSMNAGGIKLQYFMRLRTRADIGELKTTAWHARGQEFESPYLHR